MDPNLFHLDWDRTFEVLATIVILAFLLERALSLVFENRLFVEKLDDRPIKELIAFGLAAVVCVRFQFDAVSIIVLSERTSYIGEAITAGAIAGGSKASIKLFRDILDFKSTAVREKEERKKQSGPPNNHPSGDA